LETDDCESDGSASAPDLLDRVLATRILDTPTRLAGYGGIPAERFRSVPRARYEKSLVRKPGPVRKEVGNTGHATDSNSVCSA